MRFWVGVTAAFGAGAILGGAVGQAILRDKLQKEYESSVASQRRAWEAARINDETPVDLSSGEIHIVAHDPSGTRLEGGALVDEIDPNHNVVALPEIPLAEGQKASNPYWDSRAVDQGPGFMVSFAQLDAEDYYDEDGRDKQQITMVFVDGAPQFFQEGEEIDNAFDLVGGTIVDDMRESVRNGEPILWIRNNQTEIDYEVSFEQP